MSFSQYAHTISKKKKLFLYNTSRVVIVLSLHKASCRKGNADKLHRNRWKKITWEVMSQAHILKLISQPSENSAANN